MHDLESLIIRTAATQHGAFSSAQVPDFPAHLAQSRVTAGRWRRHRPGIFTICGSPNTWEQRLWLALLMAGDGAVVGRRSAARLFRLSTGSGDYIDIVQPETTTPRAKPRTSRRTSRLPDSHLTKLAGFPVTTVERTLFDLAGLTSPQRRRRSWVYLPAARVERVVDDALVRRQTSVAALTRTFVSLSGRGRPGTALMRQLLEARSGAFVPTESDLEDLFTEFVDRFDLPKPRRQVAVGSESAMIGQVDFLFESARLVVELDSRAFHSQRMVQRNDRRRDLQLLREGWRVLRLGWNDLRDDGAEIAALLGDILAGAAA